MSDSEDDDDDDEDWQEDSTSKKKSKAKKGKKEKPILEKFIHRKISFVPGLYKIFDEILVNAADHKVRDPKGMTQLKVNIDRESGRIR